MTQLATTLPGNTPAQIFPTFGHRTAPLTRAEMLEIIARGESVLFKGRIISHQLRVPTEAELAVGDPAAEVAALAQLRSEVARLQGLMADLQAGTLARPAVENAPRVPMSAPETPPPPTADGPGPPGMTAAQFAEMRAAQRDALLKDAPPPEEASAAGPAAP